MLSKLAKSRMKGVERVLDDDSILYAIAGAADGKHFGMKTKYNGILILIPKRVLFYATKPLGGYLSEDYPLEKISSINSGKGMLLGNIKIHATGNDIELGWIPKQEDTEGFVRAVKSHMEKIKEHADAPFSVGVDEVTSQIQKLAELVEQGILT